MSILTYCCGPLHPKAMNGVCVGRRKQESLSDTFLQWTGLESWRGENLGISAISWNLVPIKLWGTWNRILATFTQVKLDNFCNNPMSILFITLLIIGTPDREGYAAFLWLFLKGNVSKEVKEVSVNLALVSPCREPAPSPGDGTDRGVLGLCF